MYVNFNSLIFVFARILSVCLLFVITYHVLVKKIIKNYRVTLKSRLGVTQGN